MLHKCQDRLKLTCTWCTQLEQTARAYCVYFYCQLCKCLPLRHFCYIWSASLMYNFLFHMHAIKRKACQTIVGLETWGLCMYTVKNNCSFISNLLTAELPRTDFGFLKGIFCLNGLIILYHSI